MTDLRTSSSPLPDILDFLLHLFMSRSSELKRDEVREQARGHWMALSVYLKDQVDVIPVDPDPNGRHPDPIPPRREAHRNVRARFQPRHRQIA